MFSHLVFKSEMNIGVFSQDETQNKKFYRDMKIEREFFFFWGMMLLAQLKHYEKRNTKYIWS